MRIAETSISVVDWRGPGGLDATALRRAMEADGALVVRGLLAPEEIERVRGLIRTRLVRQGRRLSLGKTQPNAAVEDPELAWAVAHPNVIEVFKRLLDGPVFTGHCDIHMNMLSGWHKDSGELHGGYFSGDYFQADDCRVYKAAIYMQKAGSRDGLTVRPGSHRTPAHAGEPSKIMNDVGDVVFFDVRLSHTGQLPDLVETGIKAAGKLATRGSRFTQEPPWIFQAKEAYWKAIGRRDRLSMFFTYGAPNRYTEEFAAANMERQARQAGADKHIYPPDLLDHLRRGGVSAALVA